MVLSAAPASDDAFETVDALRDSVHAADPGALVGGSDAQARDASAAAVRDRLVIIPAILAVVLAVLYVLLRAALAPLVLVAVTVLRRWPRWAWAAGSACTSSAFPRWTTPPRCSRSCSWWPSASTTRSSWSPAPARRPRRTAPGEGIVRAVSATGAVITSAGIVLAAVFCVLGVLPLIVLTQLGIIVGLGILLDTFVVRTVIIPALFTLIGPRIWWPALREAGYGSNGGRHRSTPRWGG